MNYLSVSLIMPVYNTERTLLCNAIESIKEQTCDRWNLWIVDDGSCEEISKLCDSYTNDSRIQVIHQVNSGVSVARNNGTKYSNDAYVMYVDSDDILTSFAIEEALELASKTDADIIYGAVYQIKNQNEIKKCLDFRDKSDRINEYKCDDLKKWFLGGDVSGLNNIQGNGYIGRGPWAKLIKKNIAIMNPFPVGLPIGEDLLWNLKLLKYVKKVIVAKSVWYGYVQYPISAISKYYGNREQLVIEWLNIVRNDNKDFFIMNKSAIGKLLATEFYCIIHFDILSPKNVDSIFKKNRIVYQMLNRKPWINLLKKKYRTELTFFQKAVLFFAKFRLGASTVSMYIYLKNKKNLFIDWWRI